MWRLYKEVIEKVGKKYDESNDLFVMSRLFKQINETKTGVHLSMSYPNTKNSGTKRATVRVPRATFQERSSSRRVHEGPHCPRIARRRRNQHCH